MACDAVTWVLVSVSTAGAPASLRVQVWRKLRSLGAHYLQQSVCLLPDLPAIEREMGRLRDRVEREGGTIQILHLQFVRAGEADRLIAEFNREREVEFGEVLERIPEFMHELETELARGRTTYAEVEESEADLNRFQTWLAKIDARDYFHAPRGIEAHAAVNEAVDALARFEAAALQAETGHEAEPHDAEDRRRLRAVADPEAG